MNGSPKALYGVIREARACFHALRAISDQMLSDLDLNASMRAVLEAATDGPPRTVPDIARQKRVSRQHIQVNVNALVERGLVRLAENPAHKRSPLVVRTELGRQTLAAIREREAPRLEAFAAHFPAEALETTKETLRQLRASCEADLEGGKDDD